VDLKSVRWEGDWKEIADNISVAALSQYQIPPMKEKSPFLIPIVFGLLLLAVVLFLLPDSLFSGFGLRRGSGGGLSDEERVAGRIKDEPEADSTPTAYDPLAAQWAALLAKLNSKNARPNEAVLTFESAEAMKAFLDRANAAGLKVLGKIDSLNAVRVGFDNLAQLRADMMEHPGDYTNTAGNYLVQIPSVPLDNRPQQQEVGFGDGMLNFMGVKGDFSNWGKGVTIAILDTGISDHPAFAASRVKSIDIGMGITGTSEEDGHGTAVASLAGGAVAGATGVAPASDLLSIRVTDSTGTSDMFTLAQGIQAAVDAGAKIINISLGAYNDSSILSRMIDYADSHGAVIVASAGNDQSTKMTWPAANPLVVSVGAVDAVGQQVTFSNSGDNLSATAPGLGLNTAWPGGQIVSFDGTSGSAPLMSGAIAAVMSLNPNLTARQAASLLTTYSADAGAPGPDPDYGNGTIDIGYALNHDNPNYFDTSVSSQYFHPDQNSMEFVVQNRSGSTVSNMTLNINAAGVRTSVPVPDLQSGERWSYTVPVDQGRLATEGQLTYTSQLRNPSGLVDANPGNNGKASVVFKPVE
jgi:hypothetical protein